MRVALHNLGCKVNTYETDAMRQSLLEHGYEIAPFEEGADVYIINTCSVTNIADRKSRQMLHKAKKMNNDAIVVATGCYVQTAGEEILKDEAIDIVVGNNNKAKIVEIIEEFIKDKEKNKMITDISHPCEYEDMLMTTVTEHTRAFIKIQDGCNQFCSYCIIPYARGRIRSRRLDDIKVEVEALAGKGYKEIVLTGIHLSSYGKDMKDEDISLISAIKLVADIDGVERVRLGSLEPMIISEEFMEEMSKIKEFCPHFHLSLQSGCDATLKRMNRHYTADMYYEKCEIIRKYYEDAAITTDVIVGFPGETDEDFEMCKEFLEKVNFAEMHVFKFSVRKGTVAERMENQIDENVKSQRSDILIELGDNMNRAYKEKLIGKEVDVLVEETVIIDGKDIQVGHTMEYIKIGIEHNEDISGKIVKVCVEELSGEILLARLIDLY